MNQFKDFLTTLKKMCDHKYLIEKYDEFDNTEPCYLTIYDQVMPAKQKEWIPSARLKHIEEQVRISRYPVEQVDSMYSSDGEAVCACNYIEWSKNHELIYAWHIDIPHYKFFRTEEDYSLTLLHEIGHHLIWTSGIYKQFGYSPKRKDIAEEEALVELFAYFMCTELYEYSVEETLPQVINYILTYSKVTPRMWGELYGKTVLLITLYLYRLYPHCDKKKVSNEINRLIKP